MSWGINFTGTKKGVRKKVQDAKAYGDQSQLDFAKAFIVAEIDAIPDSVSGVHVEAGGHHGDTTRNIHIKVEPVWLALDDEDVK